MESGSDFLLEMAWGIIANSGGGDWTKESADWQEAATRWREEYFTYLNTKRDDGIPLMEEV